MKAQIKVLIISLYALIFAACGTAEVPKETVSASSVLSPRDDSGSSSQINEYLDCSAMEDTSLGLKVNMTTFFDSISQSYVADFGRIRFKSAPAALSNGAGEYMQMFRWGVDLNGQRNYNQNPVSFYVQLRTTGQYLILSQNNGQNSYTTNTISQAMMSNVISINNLGLSGVTVSNFLEQVLVVATGLEDLSYKALTVALYKSGQSSAYNSADILIPAFAADPNLYAATQSSSQLQSLHPLWDIRTQNWTEAEYLAEGNKNCL